MTLSGTSTFDLDVAELVEEAYERAGLRLTTAYDLKTARRSLNLMAAEWSNRGLNLWTVDSGTVSFVAGTAAYALPADTIDLIEHVRRSGSGTSQVDINMTRIPVSNYAAIPNKTLTGPPINIYISRTATPSITVWPVPDAAYTLVYWRLRRMNDTGIGGSYTLDVPSRFLPAMAAGLAYYIAMKRPETGERAILLKQVYDEQFQLAADEDRDRSSLVLVPG